VTHTYICFDGFEVQADASDEMRAAAVNGTPVIETSITRYSRASFKLNANTQNFYYRGVGFDGAGSWAAAANRNYYWDSFAFRLETAPSSDTVIGEYSNTGATIRSQLSVTSTGALKVANEGAAATDTSAVLTLGQWYILSYLYSVNAADTVVIRNADTSGTLDTITVAENGGGTPHTFGIGVFGNVNGMVAYVDNFAMECSNTLADIDDPVNNLTTKYACGLMLPDGAGFYDAWTGTYADVDDVPHDDDATVRTATTALSFTQTLTPTSALAAQVGIIKAAMHFVFVKASATLVQVELRLRSGGTDVDATAQDAATLAYECIQLLRTTDPATSSAWTVSGVDSAEVGADRPDAGDTLRCTLVGLELLYTIGEVTRTKVIAYVMDDFDPERRVFDARSGEELPYEEVQPNVGWLRVTSGEMPDSSAPEDAWEDDTLLPIDSVRYSQDASGPSLDIIPSSEGLAEQLIRGLANTSGSL